jgi:hypothetical protein
MALYADTIGMPYASMMAVASLFKVCTHPLAAALHRKGVVAMNASLAPLVLLYARRACTMAVS